MYHTHRVHCDVFYDLRTNRTQVAVKLHHNLLLSNHLETTLKFINTLALKTNTTKSIAYEVDLATFIRLHKKELRNSEGFLNVISPSFYEQIWMKVSLLCPSLHDDSKVIPIGTCPN